jgi:plasmid stabilization system protein ParE
VRVHGTDTAVDHLLSIYEYVAQDSETYADRLMDRLTRRSEQIDVLAVIHSARESPPELGNE